MLRAENSVLSPSHQAKSLPRPVPRSPEGLAPSSRYMCPRAEQVGWSKIRQIVLRGWPSSHCEMALERLLRSCQLDRRCGHGLHNTLCE